MTLCFMNLKADCMVSVRVGGARGSHEAAGQKGCHECHCHRVVLYLLLDVQSRASLETVVQVMVGVYSGLTIYKTKPQ